MAPRYARLSFPLCLQAVVVMLSVLPLACGGGDEDKVSSAKYQAMIRWDTYGVPHIESKDLGGVFYGQGYAFARDNICVLADQIVKVRSERSKYFGAGEQNAHIQSDFAYKAMRVVKNAEETYPNLSADARTMVDGWVAGYNRRLTEVGPAGLPEPCRNAAWVKPITALDLIAYGHDLAKYASARNLKAYLASTIPPTDVASAELPGLDALRPLDRGLSQLRDAVRSALATPNDLDHAAASNGWAVGKDKSATGKGMLIANPHFPWSGELRLWEAQLTVPGKLDVAGAALYGVPGILIGHNQHVAYTATVSASRKMTAYKLTLVAGNPMQYLDNGVPKPITSRQESIEVLGTDGKLTTQTRTFYRTEFGPLVVIPALAEWTTVNAYAIRDGNENNQKLYDHFLALAFAKDIDGVEAVLRDVQGNPWTNTTAVDDQGHAYYSESNSTPNLPAQAMADHAQALKDGDLLTTVAWQLGVVFLDANKLTHQWIVKAGSREPGLVPYAETPHLRRDDFTLNANDSHWITNPAQLLEGFGPLYGLEKTERSLRTRWNFEAMMGQGATAPAGEDGKFTFTELRDMIFSNRTWTGEHLAAQVVGRCTGAGKVQLRLKPDGKPCVDDGKGACANVNPTEVDIAPACAVLTKWDKRWNADSQGAVLFREWLFALPVSWKVPFDVKDPLATPRDLADAPAKGDDPVLVALATASYRLTQAKRPLDAKLGDVQFTLHGATRVPIHGGLHSEGAFHVIGATNRNDTLYLDAAPAKALSPSSLNADGYPLNYGTSFVMAVEFTDAGPHAEALLTYSQSADPASPFYADQTKLFEQAKFRAMPFTKADVLADPKLVTVEVKE